MMMKIAMSPGMTFKNNYYYSQRRTETSNGSVKILYLAGLFDGWTLTRLQYPEHVK